MRKYKKKATFSRSISSFLSILWIFLIYLSVSLIKFLYYIQYCFFWRKCVNIIIKIIKKNGKKLRNLFWGKINIFLLEKVWKYKEKLNSHSC